MGKFFVFFVAVVLVPIEVCCISKGAQIELYKRNAYNSVGKVIIDFEMIDPTTKQDRGPVITATAFAINGRYLATAGHFCISAFQLALQSSNVKTALAYVDKDEEISISPDFKIIAIDAKNDLCILDKPNHKLTPVTFEDDYHPKIRDKVFTIGAPHGTFPIESEGHISSPFIFSTDEEMNGKIMASLAIYRGNSGSPVFNDKRKRCWSHCYGK